MGTAQDHDYYDHVYSTSEAYRRPYSETAWAPLWQFVVKQVLLTDRVLDLGCGPGHLAAALIDAGVPPANYVGVDFSSVAIGQASARAADATFLRAQIPGCLLQLLLRYSPDVVTFCEVLEHLGHDEDLMSIHLLSAGQRVIGTVPNFDDPAHARVFESPDDVVARYGKILDIEKLDWITRSHLGFVAHRRRR